VRNKNITWRQICSSFFLPIPWLCHIFFFSLFPSRSRPWHNSRLRWRMPGAHGRGAIQKWTGSQAFPQKKNRQSFLVTYRRLPACRLRAPAPQRRPCGWPAGPPADHGMWAEKSCFPRTCFVCSDLLSFRFCFILPPPFLGLRVRKANRPSTRAQLSSDVCAHVPRCTSTDFTIAHR
jgi:hypothetical protein